MQVLKPCFLFLLLCFFCSCGGEPRLLGKWVFDRPYTEAQLPKQLGSQKQSTFEEMQQQLAASLIPVLIGKLDGMTVTFTSKEMIVTTKEGSGQALTYEILERPTADSWRIKKSDGKVETYYREGERLASDASGDIRMRVYLKRGAQ